MKSLIVALIGLFLTTSLWSQDDQTVMEINGKKVSKAEFLQIYLKNNPNPKYDKASLDEYMDLFKKFKLKVAEAEALGYDTVPKLKKELEGYRKSLALPYMVDNEKNEQLIQQAYERMKKEIRASHILVRLNENPLPADTLAAYNKCLQLKKRIEGGEDFASVAKGPGGSDDPSAVQNGGDLGYFTAFQMVYPFEEAAYNTPIGKISNPVRTRFGYHILKVVGERPARGTLTVAHIMIASTKEDTKEDAENHAKKAKEIYEKVKAGDNFETLVEAFSDDFNSNEKAGVLPPFGTGTTTRMLPEFEEAAFALKEDGQISEPVKTQYGYHIIKRISWKNLAPYENMKKDLQNKIKRDDRSKKTQDLFVAKLKNEYKYTDRSKKSMKPFVKSLDSNYYTGAWKVEKIKSDAVMFELDGKGYTQKKFAQYLAKNYSSAPKLPAAELASYQYNAWVKASVLEYEETKLEQKHPDFKALMQEYHDGILLYEVMTDKVWSKASKDSTGLRNHYSQNQSKYQWKERINANVYECATKEIADEVDKMLKTKGVTAKDVTEKINAKSELNLRVRSGKYEISETAFLKGHTFVKGLNPIYQVDGKFYVVKVEEVIPAAPKSFDEAKGAITSDYQSELEKNWLNELAQKHTVKVNESVLYSLGK